MAKETSVWTYTPGRLYSMSIIPSSPFRPLFCSMVGDLFGLGLSDLQEEAQCCVACGGMMHFLFFTRFSFSRELQDSIEPISSSYLRLSRESR